MTLAARRWHAAVLIGTVVISVVRAAQLPIRRYTIADGLADNTVLNITTDARGYLWFATASGLSRFDGYTFSNLTRTTGLPGNAVYQVLVDRRGIFWLATSGGLVRFRPELPPSSRDRVIVYRPHGRAGSEFITTLVEDRNGTIWCGAQTGLFRINPDAAPDARLSAVDVEWSVSPIVNVLALDRDGAIWIGTRSGHLYRRLPAGRIEHYNGLAGPYSEITDLLFDRQGRLWIGTEDGLYRTTPPFSPDSSVFEPVHRELGLEQHRRIFVLFESRKGDIWAGMYQYLAQFPAGGRPAHLWSKQDGIPRHGPTAIGQDHDGNLWLGSADTGIARLAASGFLTYGLDELAGAVVKSVSETREGELYTGGQTEAGKLAVRVRSGERFLAVHPRVPPGVKYFGWKLARILLQDHAGEWWIASYNGLLRYPCLRRTAQLESISPKKVYTSRDGLPSNSIVRLFEDRNSNLWIGMEHAGAAYMDRSRNTFHIVQATEMDRVSAFGEDRAGNVWIGDEGGRLWRVYDGRAALITGSTGRGWINDFLLDHKGRLWVATSANGLMRFDDPASTAPRFHEYGLKEGLSSLNTCSLAEGLDGSIYIGTRRGVDQLEPNLIHFRYFTAAEGIAEGSVNAVYRDRNGVLWFGTHGGLTQFTAANHTPGVPPDAWITGLSINGRSEPISELGQSRVDQVDVPYGQQQIQFDFLALSFAPGDVLRYQYRIGNDRWSEPIQSRSVHYGGLAPGNYRFVVRAINSDGQVSSKPAEVDFRVIPPLWRRVWFQVLLLAAVVAGAVSAHQARVRRAVAVERVRTRIATDLHDDIGSALSQIAILSEVARQRRGREDESEPLERIGGLSRELLDSIGDIVWAIQPHKDHLSDLKQRMRRFAVDVLSTSNVEMHWPATGPGGDFDLESGMRREVYLIFKEAIRNVVRHSRATEARISLGVADGYLWMEVSDNGRGMAPCETREGNGLNNMKLRAAKLRGELDVRSEGQGTTLRLRAPLSM